jgi:hypothetical protein
MNGDVLFMTNEMIEQIKQVMGQARSNVAKTVNSELIRNLNTYITMNYMQNS